MNMKTYSSNYLDYMYIYTSREIRFERYGCLPWCMTRITVESANKPTCIFKIRHLTCTGSPGPLVASQQSQKRPGELQVGHQARMQCGTGVVSQ